MKNYQEQLHEHMEQRPYRPETIQAVGRMCRVGRISEETAIDFLEAIEADEVLTAEVDCDRVFVGQLPIEYPVVERTDTAQLNGSACTSHRVDL